MHTEKNHDGMKVLVVSDMNRKFDEDGNLVSSKDMGNVEIVHASEIAKHYGIPLRTIGTGDNEVPGIWAMVHQNEIGQRVAYNSDHAERGNRHIRTWRIIKDANGQPIDTEERIVRATRHWNTNGIQGDKLVTDETDDGMYVKLSDLLEFASTQGWSKGAGRPNVEGVAKRAISLDDKLDGLASAMLHQAKVIEGLVQLAAQNTLTQAATTPVAVAKK